MSDSETKLHQILDALVLLGISADSLFDRIKQDLDRGLIQEARAHLNFVDEILKEAKPISK